MLKGELVKERSSWARQSERLGSLRYGGMAVWPDLGTTPVALWGGTLRMHGRFVRGTVWGETLRMKGRFYERNRSVYPLVSWKVAKRF